MLEKRILDYFDGQAGTLFQRAISSRVFENSPGIGINRENILKDFLKYHIPKRCNVINGGFVFDKENNTSKQIDLIITNDLSIQFVDNDINKSFTNIEGCNSVISVKSKLNTLELKDSIDNLKSVPFLKNLNYSPLVANVDKVLKQVPHKIIFAYDGLSKESIVKTINEIEITNPEEMPDMIIVNNKYYLWKVSPGGTEMTTKSGPIKYNYGRYIVDADYCYVGSMALFHLLSWIQKIAHLSSHIYYSYSEYLDKVEFYAKKDFLN